MSIITEMLQHAAETFPNEACGLVVTQGKKFRLIRAANLSPEPKVSFDLDPNAWLEVPDGEQVIGIYHSHPNGTPEPSMADLAACEASQLPWHIVSYPGGGYQLTQPSGYQAPYLERPYVYGVMDCYTMVQDWYSREYGICLPNFERGHVFDERGGDLYEKNFEANGFVRLIDAPLQIGDVLLMRVLFSHSNHSAIFVGGGMILHHAGGRLSSKDVYGGMWEKHTTHHLRHKSKF